MTYYGLTSNAFKTRYNQHKVDFRDQKKRGSTKLSNHIWELKEKNVPHEVKWSIKARAMTYKPGSRRCDLCLVEKTVIALAEPKTTLNSRSEILSKCRHKTKFCLSNF